MNPVRPTPRPHQPHRHVAPPGEGAHELIWPTAFRALLLLTDAAHATDPTLARLSDDDLAMLRASLARLAGTESTSVA